MFTLIAVLVTGLVPFQPASAQFQQGGVDHPGDWYVGEGLKKGDFFSYTGDKAEGLMLKIYRLKPNIGERKTLSAASVKQKMYDAALGKDTDWEQDVNESIANIIKEEWEIVKKFAESEDMTTRVAGMKFPKEGWSSK